MVLGLIAKCRESMITKTQLAFIGVGNIGKPIAMNLLNSGYEVTVFDIDRAKTTDLKRAGATVADTLEQAVLGSDIVMVSLPGPPEVEQVMLGDDGLLALVKPGATVIDTSTGSVELARQLASSAAVSRINYLEAPITNAVDSAELGKLSIFVSGPREAFERCRPIFDVVGEKIFYFEKAGSATTVKLLTNLLWFVGAATIGEALMLGAKAGIPLNDVWEAIKSSAGNSWVAEHDVPSIFAGHYDPSFSLALCCKDLTLINDLALSEGYRLPMASHALALFEEAKSQYGPDAAELHVTKLLEDRLGHYLRPDAEGGR